MPYLTTGHWDNVKMLPAKRLLCWIAELGKQDDGHRPLTTDGTSSGLLLSGPS